MSEIKMDLDVVTEFFDFMVKKFEENDDHNDRFRESVNLVVGKTFIAPSAEQFDKRYMDIYKELSSRIGAEREELLLLVKKEMEDFRKTGEHLG